MTTDRPQAWHWPHLTLLAVLPPFAWLTREHDATLALFGWLVLNVTLLAGAERMRAFRDDWRPEGADLKRDAGAWSINALADAIAGVAIALLGARLSAGTLDGPVLLQIVVGAWLAELGSYALHRISHGDNWLWRVHLLHHRPHKLNLANALTAHPLNALYDKVARVLPLVLLGFDAHAIVAITLFQLTQSLVTHANVRGRIGWLNHLIGSAELHRLHHSDNPADAGNFGTALPLWDQVFGSFRYQSPPRQVGVYTPQAYPGEHQLLALLAWPWRR